MTQQSIMIRLFGGAAILLGGWSTTLMAKNAGISSTGPHPSQGDRAEYFACRKSVLDQAKTETDEERRVAKSGLNACKDAFPAAAIFVECKRDALTVKKDQAKEALKACKETYSAMRFEPDQLAPFYHKDGLNFFAGAGLDIPRKISRPSPDPEDGQQESVSRTLFGNFDCSPLTKAFSDKNVREHILFGNHLNVFGNLATLSKAEQLRLLQPPKVKDKKNKGAAFIHHTFGEVSPISGTAPLATYFPSSYCFFTKKMGDNFQAMKIYYLIDAKRGYAIPYFGTAFYEKQRQPSLATLKELVSKNLGSDFAESKLKSGAIIYSRTPITTFDSEGDPFNLCQKPRPNEIIALIKPDPTGQKAEYLLLSNIDNLCKHGDRLARDLNP